MKKGMHYIIALLLAGALLAGCAAMGGRTAGEMIDDSTIVATTKSRIVKDPQLSVFNIIVDSYQGNVTLIGRVPTKEAETRLLETVKGVPGVKSVKNNLVVEEKKLGTP